MGLGGSTAGGGSTSSTLGTGGSAAGSGKGVGTSSTMGAGGSTAGHGSTSSTVGTGGSAAGTTGLDKADKAAGDHGKQGREIAREHQDDKTKTR